MPNAWNQIKREGEAGSVSTWHNGKEREKDGDVMMVDVIYTVCRTWTLAPLAHLGEKKKRKKKESSLGKSKNT